MGAGSGEKKPDRKESIDGSIDVSKGTEFLSLGDVKKDPKVRAYLDGLDFMKDFPDSCKVAKAVFNSIKLLAYDKAGIDTARESKLVKDYFDGKKREYSRTHNGESSDKPKERQRLKEGVQYNMEYVKEIPGMGRYLFMVPEGFDGSVDMYFPGDTYSIEMANSTMGLTGHARNKKSALLIVEGDASCFRDNQKNRYAKFNLNKLVGHFKGQTGLDCKSFNFMGHSRGGSALGKLLDKFQNKPDGVTFTFLDANYWSGDIPKIVKFVKNGGRLNIAFQSNPDYGPGNKQHHTKIQSIVSSELIPRLQAVPGLNLRRVGNTWESQDGRVVIQNAGALTHSQVPQRYVDRYMVRDSAGKGGQTEIGTALTEAERAEGGRGSTMVGQYASAGEVVVGKPSEDTEPYGEEHLEEFFKDVEGRRKDRNVMDKFSSWASQQTDVEVLRGAEVSVEENMKDPFEKHVRLASEYITSGVRVNGHVGFTVDFKGNETAEWKVGAGHILPPTVKAVRVYDESGNVLFDRAERKVVNGRVGYFTETGEYAYIHTGYQVAILEVQSVADAETQARMKEENELFEAEEKKITAKKYLAEYLKDQRVDIEIDDIYFESALGGFTNQMYPEWWEDYKKSKLETTPDAAQLEEKLKSEFTKVFETEFTPENKNFIKNLLRLRDAQAFDKLSLSDYFGLKKDPKFEPLKKEMTDDEVAAFRKDTLGGKDLSDFLVETKEVLSDEPFVKDVDDFGNRVVLRASAMSAFRRAKAIAASKGIKLEVYSSYRTLEHQQRLWDKAAPDRRGTFVASPGGSPHHTGGAIDIRAYRRGKKDQSLLQQVLPEAGFVNYEAEDWHWEIYTARWKRISRKSGAVYGKEMAFNAKKAQSYDDYLEQQHQESFVATRGQRGESVPEEASLGSSAEVRETDSAFTQILYGEAERMWRDPRRSDTRGSGNCQHNAGFLAERVLAGFGRRESINCPRTPLDRDATEKLRGRKVSSLGPSDFNGLRSGVVFYVSKTEEYPSSKLRPDSSGKIPVVADTGRHWFTYLGKDSSGGVVLTDNHGVRRSVDEMRRWVGNRTVLNIHDPYADLRGRMYSENGQVKLRKTV